MASSRVLLSPAKEGNGAAGVSIISKDERGRARRREEEEEREAFARRKRAREQGQGLTRREKATEGIKNTAKIISEGWSNINWTAPSGLAARARTLGGNTWIAVRNKIGALPSKDKTAAVGGRTRRKKKGVGLGKIGNRSKMPKRSPREQLLEQQQQKRTDMLPSSSSSSSSVNKVFSLPSLLQRIDPSAYTASMWNQMMASGKAGREGEREGRNDLLPPPVTERPYAFDDLVKFPAGPAEAWDLFVDDTRHFFDSVYKVMAPASAMPKPGPSRPQVGGIRPKAEKVKQGPLNAVPLVLRQKMGSALAPWWPPPPPLPLQQEQEQGEEGMEPVVDETEDKEREEEDEEDRWQDLRGRVKNMIEETSGAPSGAEYYALLEEEEEVLDVSKEKERGLPISRRATKHQQQKKSQKNLPVPLQAPRLVDRLDERPRGISSGATFDALSTPAGRGVGETMDAWVPLPPFPSQPPMEDEYWPAPLSSSSSSSSSFLSSSTYRASSAFDGNEEERDEDGIDWDDDGDEEDEEEEEGGVERGVVSPWRRGLPDWLQRVSLTRLLVRKPTPERMLEIIRRRQQVRRMPRKMDDVFLRTVSRKLQGNRVKIRAFQLQTDRYRNSLLSAQAYVDAVVLLFGTSKDAEEVLWPLTRWLPEASKRRGLAEECKARRRARLGLSVGNVRRGGAKDRGGRKEEKAGTMAMVGDVRKAAVLATTAWLARVGTTVSGWFTGGMRGMGAFGRGLAQVLSSNSTLIELSFETGKENYEEEVGKDSSEVWREGEGVDPAVLRALAGFERELEWRGQQAASAGGKDDPMARIVDILGDKNAAYFQQRLELYLRGGLPGMELYRALKRLCLANEMRLDLVMRQLREESMREDQKWKSKNEKLAALLRIHEGQRKVTW